MSAATPPPDTSSDGVHRARGLGFPQPSPQASCVPGGLSSLPRAPSDILDSTMLPPAAMRGAKRWCLWDWLAGGATARPTAVIPPRDSLLWLQIPPAPFPGPWKGSRECCLPAGNTTRAEMSNPLLLHSLPSKTGREAGLRQLLPLSEEKGEPGPAPTWPERQRRGTACDCYMALGLCCRRRRGQDSFCCMESARLAGEPDTVGKWVSLGVCGKISAEDS